MLLCMKELEDVELTETNVNIFFNKINNLLGNNNYNNNDNKNKNDLDQSSIKTIPTGKLATEIKWALSSILIYYQNVRNLRNKNHIIKPKTIESNYDIIALTETCFDNGNKNEEYFSKNYSVFRCDRSESNSMKCSGGGCLIAIKKT